MHSVRHAIGFERGKNRILHLRSGWNGGKSECMGRIQQAADVFIELQRPPVEDAQALPHGITALHHTVSTLTLASARA